MVSIVSKKIKGKEYLYLVSSIRKKGRVIQKTIKYIGRKRPIPDEEFKCMKFSYENEDWVLNELRDELSYQDHEEMKKASDSYKEYIKTLDKVSKEKERERFLSIFISNSNAIEGSTLTVKDTFNYLFSDIVPAGHTKKELHMATNLMNAWNYVEKNHHKSPKKEYLLALHSLTNKGIESNESLGKYKHVQNYVADNLTSSFLFTEEKMAALLRWIKKAFENINDFEAAFQSHAQFEIIHPFVDGNGRVGRLLLNWLLMYKRYMPVAVPALKRETYISTLDNARNGNLGPICKFFFKTYTKQYKFVG